MDPCLLFATTHGRCSAHECHVVTHARVPCPAKRTMSKQQLAESIQRLSEPRWEPPEPGEKLPTPAPGGLLPVPSFVADDQRIGKGVQFGHRLKTRREIEATLGVCFLCRAVPCFPAWIHGDRLHSSPPFCACLCGCVGLRVHVTRRVSKWTSPWWQCSCSVLCGRFHA